MPPRNLAAAHSFSDVKGHLKEKLTQSGGEPTGFPLRRVGSGKRMTFTHLGERWLGQWMEENAFVSWLGHPRPWTVENQIVDSVSLPLNIQGNSRHPFVGTLSFLRRESKRVARESPIADEGDQQNVCDFARGAGWSRTEVSSPRWSNVDRGSDGRAVS